MAGASERLLLGDIGGTNARFALLDGDALSPVVTLPVAKFAGIGPAIERFLEHVPKGEPVGRAILAAAGQVKNGSCTVTNSAWRIEGAELRRDFGFARVDLVNDFEALAWAVPDLGAADLRPLGGGIAVPDAPRLVIGPGTGLGLAYLLTGRDGPLVVATEGGHMTLPAGSDREEAVIARLRARFGHVSAERALSGAGLENLYAAVRAIDGLDAPERGAQEITRAALAGGCAASRAALDLFCVMLGTVAGNAALLLGARGGVYIAGGIPPRIVDYLARSSFRESFEAKGRLSPYLAAIPAQVIVHPAPAFVGLKALARRG